MDSEQFAPESSQDVSNSPGSSPSSSTSSSYSSSSPRSRDSDIEVSINKLVENSEITGSSDSSDGEDENGEFVSGGEEFEEEPPVPAEELEQGYDSDAPFMESSGFPKPIAVPVARASVIDSDDDDDDIVGGSKGVAEEDGEEGVLKESSLIGNGGSDDKGLKIFGVSGSVENGGIGGVGVEEVAKPVTVVKGLGENGCLGEFVIGSGIGNTLEGNYGGLVGSEQDKVLEIPNLGIDRSSVTEESSVPEKVEEEGTPVKDEVPVEVKEKVVEEGTGLSSGIDKVEPVIVELVNEKLQDEVMEPVIVEAMHEPATILEDEEGTASGNVVDKVEPANVELVNEKLQEPDVVELAGKGNSVVEAIHEPAAVLEDEGTASGNVVDKVEPVIVEPVNEELGEANGTELAGEGDSVVEAIHVDLLASRTAVVGDLEESKLSKIKEMDSLVGASVNVDNVFEQISPDAEVSEKIAELSMGKFSETTEVECIESNGLETVGKGNDEDMSAVVSTLTKNVQDFEKLETSTVENHSVGLLAEEKPKEVDAGADSDSKQSDMVVDIAANKENFLYSSEVDGDETKISSDSVVDAIDVAEPAKGKEIQVNAQGEQLDEKVNSFESLGMTSHSNSRDILEAEDEEEDYLDEEGEIENSSTDEEDGIFGSSEAAKQFLEGLERRSDVDSHDHSQRIDGQIVTDSDEEADTDEEEDGKELFDPAALAALLKAATGTDSEGGNITITSKDGSKLFSVERPAGLGSSLRPVKPPTSWSNRPNLFSPSTLSTGAETENNLSDEEKQKLEKLQQIRVKFLRLVQRLGYSAEDQIAAQVLYRLALVAGRKTNQPFSLDVAKRTASQLEEEGKDDLNFSLNILVLGKTGVGKSSTINAIFGEEKSQIDAFEYATTAVKEISGTVGGVRIRVFDTPGLKTSVFEQGYNQKVLSSVKKFTKKCPPDIVLYVDRMDTQTRDLNDLPMLKTITSTLGASIWRSAIVTLTHASSAPPDGPTGNPLSYEVFVAQRSHIVQQSIGQAVGDLRTMNPSSMNPVSLVENHPSCRKNREGLKVLPNGQSWKPQLLFLCYSMKILSEASSLSKPQDPFDHRKLFGFRVHSPPLPYLLSWLLQSRTHPKLLTDQGRNDVGSDIFDDEDDQGGEEEEEEEEYDQLPPFRPLTKEQLKRLTKEQRNAYFDEYEYRVKLLQKKQWKEMKKGGKVGADDMGEGEGPDGETDNANDGMVSVPLPDMVLPHSFDGDDPAYRYRFLDPQSHLLARPVLDTHSWDHDCGYDGVNIENRALAIKNQYPASVAVQMTKDKKEFSIHLDSSISAKHGEKGSSMLGFDVQNVGKQLAYIVRAESKFKNHKRNKTTAGASVTFLGENVATGIKVEDQLALGKRFLLIGSTGTVRSKGDAAYGANMEVQLRETDYPIGQDQSSLGISLVKWRGDLALGANLQSQVTVGRGTKVTVRAGLNNKRSGQISIALNSTEQLQLALVGIVPLARAIYKTISPGVSGNDNYSMY